MGTQFGYPTKNGSGLYLTFQGGVGAIRNRASLAAFNCPSTGNQELKLLGTSLSVTGGVATPYARIAIFTAAGAFIAQTERLTLIYGEDPVQYHDYTGTTFYDQSGRAISNPILTGGDNYIIAVSSNGATSGQYSGVRINGYTGYNPKYAGIASDYSSGFPSTIAGGTNFDDGNCTLWGEVDPAAASSPCDNTGALTPGGALAKQIQLLL